MKSELSRPELLNAFIGSRAPSYIAVQQGQSALSWAGFIFGLYWLLYRKMYAYFFLIVLFGLFIGLILLIIGVQPQNLVWLGLLPHLFLGLMGKRLYLDFAEEKVKTYQHDPKYSAKVFAEAGGTAVSLPFLWLFTQIVVVLMLSTPFLKY